MASSNSASVQLTDSGLIFSGIIDHQSIPGLMNGLLDTNNTKPVIDLSEVSKIDSAGLAFLIHWGNTHLANADKVQLKGVSEQAKQLIGILELESVLEIQNTA
jgi:anti-anti-sigma factor